MKFLIPLLVALSVLSFKLPGGVYICTGPHSKAYHLNKECKGLKHCSTELKIVTKEEAIKLHRTPCHYCL